MGRPALGGECLTERVSIVDLVSEMKAGTRKPCTICALPSPFKEAVDKALVEGVGPGAIARILAKHGHGAAATDKRVKRHQTVCRG